MPRAENVYEPDSVNATILAGGARASRSRLSLSRLDLSRATGTRGKVTAQSAECQSQGFADMTDRAPLRARGAVGQRM